MKYRDESHAILGNRGLLENAPLIGGYEYRISGYVMTKHTIVKTQSVKMDFGKIELTILNLVKGGRHYKRVYYKAYTKRGVAMKAREFADAIFTPNATGEVERGGASDNLDLLVGETQENHDD